MFSFLVLAQVHTERTTIITSYVTKSLDLTSPVTLRIVKDSLEHILC